MVINEKGFTLIESLVVLSVFFIIISLAFLPFKPYQLSAEKQLFFSRLKSDLLYAQQYALANQELVTVNFDPNRHYYYIRKGNGGFLAERFYSKKIVVSEGSLKLFFRYTPDGNINSFGSIFIYIEEERYRMTFLLGRGRFYVVKL